MNRRGSALVSVLIVVSVLMILGTVAIRFVAADANFSLLDYNRSRALQVAEGGVDYGMMLITNQDGELSVEGVYSPQEGVTVEVFDLGDNYYRIVSTAVVNNSTRSVEVELSYNPMESPFSYSLFIGDEQLEVLRNVTFVAPVFIGACAVEFGSQVVFEAGVHFECPDVQITGTYELGPDAEVTYGPTGYSLPEVDITALGQNATNDDPITNNPDSTEVVFESLTGFNYYSGDVEITWQGSPSSPAAATDGYVVIVAEGNVRLSGNSNIDYDPVDALIIIAGGDVTGAHGDDIQNVQLPLYILSQGTVLVRNNLTNVQSVMGKGVSMGSGTQEVSFSTEEVPGLEDAWPSVLKITNWKN